MIKEAKRLQKLAGIKEIRVNNPNYEGKLQKMLDDYNISKDDLNKIIKIDDLTDEELQDLEYVEDRIQVYQEYMDLDEIKINNPIISPGEIHELYKEIWWKIDREWEDGGGRNGMMI